MHVTTGILSYTFIVFCTHALGDSFSVDDFLRGVQPWRHYYLPEKGYPCRTPNNEKALCVSLFTCPVLLQALGSLHPFSLDFVKKSLCEQYSDNERRDVLVCCGSSGNYSGIQELSSSTSGPITTTTTSTTPKPPEITTTATTTQTASVIRNFHDNKLLPDRKYCGFQHNDDRFVSDNVTALDEFPWLVHVVFLDDEDEDPEQYRDRCNGVLINNRYVLTTEYCGTYPKSVKLGQYNTNQTVSCSDNSQLTECTEPILEIPVEEEIHRLNVSDGWHDFALLRLARKIQYNDFIRPICLPLDDSEIQERSELSFSGWGATNQTGINKKRLTYQPIDISQCYELDDYHLKNVTSVVPVCLVPKGHDGVLACNGDESGPLMYSVRRQQWFADALITRVYSKPTDLDLCSDQLPIAGVKITMDIMEWIVNNIKP